MRRRYTTVKIPSELATKLDELVSEHGYKSRAEIVNDAIRRFIDLRKRLDEGKVETKPSVNLKTKQRQSSGEQ